MKYQHLNTQQSKPKPKQKLKPKTPLIHVLKSLSKFTESTKTLIMPSTQKMTLGRKGARRTVNPTYSRQTTQSSHQVMAVPEWAKGSFTLYISYMRTSIPEKMIFAVLRNYGLGMMNRDCSIQLKQHSAGVDEYPFQSAKIHFDYLFTHGDNATRNLAEMKKLVHGDENAFIKIVYQEETREQPERYWKLKLWREKPYNPEINNTDVMVIDLSSKVATKNTNLPQSPHSPPGQMCGDNVDAKLRQLGCVVSSPQIVPPVQHFTEKEMDELDAELEKEMEVIVPQASRMELIDAATEFIMESQIREEGYENPSSWTIDLKTGKSIIHKEVTPEEGELLVPAHEILDVSVFW